MSIRNHLILYAALSLLIQSAGLAQVVGINSTVIQPGTDVTVTVPFTQNSEGSFVVTGKTATSIAVTGPLTTNQFQNLFYVRMTSGAANGRWSTITANDATSLTLADTSFLSSVAVNDTFSVFRHQTIGSVFPDEFEGYAFKQSTGITTNGTQILFPNLTALGTNKSAAATFFFHSSKNWRRIGGGTASADNTIIPPQMSFIVRNQTPTGTAASDLVFTAVGRVETGSQNTSVQFAAAGADNDVATGTGVPVPITLRQLNLAGTSAFVTTTSVLSIRDTVLVFDNSQPGTNKSSSATYFVLQNASTGNVPQWRRFGVNNVSFDQQIIPPGAALLIRKRGVNPGGIANWVQTTPF